MATDKFIKLKELTLKHPEKGIISFVANGVIPMWSPVVLVNPGPGESLPRVSTTTSANNRAIIGIAVGGTGDVAGTGNAADSAGGVIDVAIIGTGSMTKCTVDGSTNTIIAGDLLLTSGTAGVAINADTVTAGDDAFTLSKALQGSSVNGDVILVIMMGGGR